MTSKSSSLPGRFTAPSFGALGATSPSRRTILLGSASIIGLAVTGCQKATDVSREQAGSSSLVIGQVGDVLVSSPVTNTGNNASWRALVLESMAVLDDETRKLAPALAASWTTDSSGKVLTFTIRDGVTWHSGRAFGPEDVVYTFKALADGKSYTRPFPQAWFLKTITDMKVSGNTLTITLKAPIAGALETMAQFAILDKDTADGFDKGTALIGTGPFKVQSQTSGASLKLAKNDKYWKAGYPLLTAVTVSIFDRTDSLLAALKTGQIQMTGSLAPRDAATLNGQNGLTITTLKGEGQGIYLGASQSSKPLQDVKVRQAIATAVDRHRIVTDIYQGGATASCAPWLDVAPAYSAETRDFYSYDPQKAKSLLAASSYAGEEIIYEISGAKPIFANIAQIVQRNLQDIGLKVKLSILQSAENDQRFQKTSFQGLYTAGDGNNDSYPPFLIRGSRAWSADNNLWKFESDELTKLADAALSAQGDQIVATGDAYTRYCLEQAVCTELVLTQSQTTTSGLKNFTHHNGELDLTEASF